MNPTVIVYAVHPPKRTRERADVVCVDVRHGQIWRGGVCVKFDQRTKYSTLPSTKFRIISAFVCAGNLLLHRDLFEAVWGDDLNGGPSCGAMNYVHSVLCGGTTEMPDGTIVRVRDALGFKVRAGRNGWICEIEWFTPRHLLRAAA
jgi:hypothetical protein